MRLRRRAINPAVRVCRVVEGSARAGKRAASMAGLADLLPSPDLFIFARARRARRRRGSPDGPLPCTGRGPGDRRRRRARPRLRSSARYPRRGLDLFARSSREGSSNSTGSSQTWPHLSHERSTGVRSGCHIAFAGTARPTRAVRLALRRMTPETTNARGFCKRQGRLRKAPTQRKIWLKNSLVRSCCGWSKKGEGAFTSTISPMSMNTTRSATWRAKPISCVTTIIVMPS